MTAKLTAAAIAEARADIRDHHEFYTNRAETVINRLLDALEEAGRALANLLRELNGEAHLTVEAVDRAEKAESSLAASDATRVRAEGERDEARRMYCEFRATLATREGFDPDLNSARQIAERRWPSAADSLFPPDEEVK